MIVGIDTTGIRSAGGIAYLIELINNLDSSLIGDGKVIVWINEEIEDKICNRECIEKIICPELSGNLIERTWWQSTKLEKDARRRGCSVIYVMNGIYLGSFKNVVTVNQNLLPFDMRESFRYGMSRRLIELILLRWINIYTYKKSKGVIFLSEYSKKIVCDKIKNNISSVVINHGAKKGVLSDRKLLEISRYNDSNLFEIGYISSIEPYKHHVKVIEAVATLRKKGVPVGLRIIGDGYKTSIKALENAVQLFDSRNEWIRVDGKIDYDEINRVYNEIDLLIYASTCETFGIPIAEAITMGVPIVCSNRSSMVQTFGDKLFYFDPLYKSSIVDVLSNVIDSRNLRKFQVSRNKKFSKDYRWSDISEKTYNFITSSVV